MNRQSFNLARFPQFNQENSGDYQNNHTSNKSMLKLRPVGSLKAPLLSGLADEIHPSTVVNKYRCFKHKTQQNSPINHRINSINSIRFSQMQMQRSSFANQQHLLKQNKAHLRRDAAKTALIMDSLMRYLKDSKEARMKHRQQKKMIHLTEESNEFFQCQVVKKIKKPKIIKNQITKKLFEAEKERKIQTEDRPRKITSTSTIITDKIDEYTFYGGKLHTLKVQSQCPISTKAGLNQMRLSKLNKKLI